MATSMTGLGEGHRLEDDLVGEVAQRVAGRRVLQTDEGVRCARAEALSTRVLLVGVHLEELADALLLALGRVEHLGARLHPAGVDAHVGELARRTGAAAILNAKAANGSVARACG
jgi:hypothetical protein